MIVGADPAFVGPDARLAEIAGILATGYRRLVLARQKGLAPGPESEPSCGPAVNARETSATYGEELRRDVA